MSEAAASRSRKPRMPGTPARPVPLPEAAAILAALPMPAVVLDTENRFRYANPAAELFFQLSFGTLAVMRLSDLLPEDSRLFALLAQVRQHESPVSDHDLILDSPRLHRRGVAAHGAPLPEMPGAVVLTLQDGSTAQMMNRQLNFLGAARGASAMAEMLAHEVKNPLSGIRGAAQLLEQGAADGDRELCQLIQDEADRIRNLVDRMDMFSDRPVELAPVNIHQVLDHVRRVAQTGFAAHLRITEEYDPSLPTVWGNRDQLVQILLNLVKNAAEAVGPMRRRDLAGNSLSSRRADRRSRQPGAGASTAAGERPGQRPRHQGSGARHAVRALRHHQAGRAGARPGAGGEAGGRPGRR